MKREISSSAFLLNLAGNASAAESPLVSETYL
jgi:hypothetical protein